MYNINIEKAVLSAILFDPEIFEEIASKLDAKDFYLPFHQYIFEGMNELSVAEKPIDEEFLRNILIKIGKFDETAMLEVLSATPISNTMAYLDEIKSKSIKRALATLATEIKKVTIEDDLPTEEVMNLVEKKLYEITQDSNTQDFRNSKEIATSMMADIIKLKSLGNSKLVGVDTGFRNLNEKTSGFGKGDLIIIAARPAMGKTALVLNIALKAIERNEGVAIFSLEMPSEQLMLRMLAVKTSIPLQAIRVGDLRDEQWSQLSSAVDTISDKKLFVDDSGYATIHHIRSKLRKLKSKHPDLSMAIIDYLQLMSGGGKEGRQQEISEISRGLKQLARELKIPILALSQLNRGLESRDNKRPLLSDLRESGCLSGDTIIYDALTGKRYRIDEIVDNFKELDLTIKSMDRDLKVNNFKITNAFFSGEKIVYKLMTQSGKTIKATANHKFYRVDGWNRLDELTIGDKIATPNKSNIYWDKIISINKIGKEKTYDLTIDDVHNFVANDIIVHNSIEQDADIVMFVYRDDVYREAIEKEKEMKAKSAGLDYDNKFSKKQEEDTEIIIGKHRNGPTGTVELVFQKNFTRFVDKSAFETTYEDENMTNGHIELADGT
ncbi:Replicative DNA helicase [hydrothermal vent metagenome]|uniref:DNA 5'-3' helicase n=1 Tax=hydrothermal vent metagenome TaxID=652676 RepID=A0A1W1CAF7_9ZZZZ